VWLLLFDFVKGWLVVNGDAGDGDGVGDGVGDGDSDGCLS
jgi:hypothetical protein